MGDFRFESKEKAINDLQDEILQCSFSSGTEKALRKLSLDELNVLVSEVDTAVAGLYVQAQEEKPKKVMPMTFLQPNGERWTEEQLTEYVIKRILGDRRPISIQAEQGSKDQPSDPFVNSLRNSWKAYFAEVWGHGKTEWSISAAANQMIVARKRFLRRRSWQGNKVLTLDQGKLCWVESGQEFVPTPEDESATDWELYAFLGNTFEEIPDPRKWEQEKGLESLKEYYKSLAGEKKLSEQKDLKQLFRDNLPVDPKDLAEANRLLDDLRLKEINEPGLSFSQAFNKMQVEGARILRRKSWSDEHFLVLVDKKLRWIKSGDLFDHAEDDIRATDWEVRKTFPLGDRFVKNS